MTALVGTTPPPIGKFAGLGLGVWAIATAAIRITPVDAVRLGPILGALALLAGLAAVVALAHLLLRDVPATQRVAAMTAFVIPGMIGDSLTTAFYERVFPNLPMGLAGPFGALMLAGYAAMLVVSLAESRPPLAA